MALGQNTVKKEIRRRKAEWQTMVKLWPTVLQEAYERAAAQGIPEKAIRRWQRDPSPLDMTFQGYKLRFHLSGEVELRMPHDLSPMPFDSPFADEHVKLLQRYEADKLYGQLPKLYQVAETFAQFAIQRVLDDIHAMTSES